MVWILLLLALFVPSLAEACQPYEAELHDAKGNILAGVSATVVRSGTSTPVTLYNTRDCTSAINNPVLSNSYGAVSFYAPDGQYDISYLKAGIVFATPVLDVAIYDPLGEHVRTVAYYPGTDICQTSTGAIDAIGSTVTTLVVNKPVTCSVSKSVPTTLTLVFTGQGTITVSGAQTLTILGQLVAPAVLIFPGPGTTTYTNQVLAYGEWTGSTGVTVLDAVTSAPKTDVVQFYPAVRSCLAFDANPSLLKPNRIAAGDTALTRTSAGAETYNIECYLTAPTRTTANKGYKLTGFKLAQQITVAALTSNTLNGLKTVSYANNVANAVAAYGGSITYTAPTATQANPYVTAGTVGTPAFMNTIDTGIVVDFTVVLQNTGVYSLYGVSATWTVQD
jgi:hypothetical protein